MVKTSPCKYCGKPVVWARRNDTSKPIPLNPAAPVYRITGHDDDGTPFVALEPLVDGERYAMLGHHHDCGAYHEYVKRRKAESR